MSNPLYQLIKDIEELPDNFTKKQVKELCLLHLDGKRVSCSYDPERESKQELAYRLLTQGFTRKDAVSIMINNFSVSKTWAYSLVNDALDKRYRKINEVNIVSNRYVGYR